MTFLDSGGQRSNVKVTAGRRGQISWTPYLTNYLSNLDETISLYSSPDCILEVNSQRSRSHLRLSVCDGEGSVYIDAWGAKVQVLAVQHRKYLRIPAAGYASELIDVTVSSSRL